MNITDRKLSDLHELFGAEVQRRIRVFNKANPDYIVLQYADGFRYSAGKIVRPGASTNMGNYRNLSSAFDAVLEDQRQESESE
jgi:hypothetical protein